MDEQEENGRSPRAALEGLADRLGVSPWSVLIGAVAVVAAAVGGWWALSAPDPPPPEDVLPMPAEIRPLVSSTSTAPSVLVVHVDGAVLDPGVHEVALGARVVDAVEAAGGLRADADRGRLNLAEALGDGQRVWVPAVGEEEPAIVAPDGGRATVDDPGTDRSGAVLDLNRASAGELEALPGVGPTIAAAIVDHREREGAFRAVEDLLDVAGIGPARLAQLAPLVTV